MGFVTSLATLKIDDTIITDEIYNFSWSYEDKDNNSPAFLEIELPNLSTEFKDKLQKDVSAIFDFGFNNKLGTLINGVIEKVDTSFYDDITEFTKLKIIGTDSNAYKEISKSYINKSVSYIIRDLANDLGFIIKTLELRSDFVFKNGYVAYGKGINLIKRLVLLGEGSLREEGNSLYIYDTTFEEKLNPYLLNFDTGLLGIPTAIEEKGKLYSHKIKALANIDIRKNSIIKVESNELNSYCKVLEYVINDFVAVYFVKTLEV